MQASRAFAAIAKTAVFASLIGSAVASDSTIRVTVTDGAGNVLPNATILYGGEKTATEADGTAFIVTDLPKLSLRVDDVLIDMLVPDRTKSNALIVLEGGDGSYKYTDRNEKDVSIPQAAPFSQLARWQTTTYAGATNDECASATDIGNMDGVFAFDNTTATSDPLDDQPLCVNPAFPAPGGVMDADVWFTWTAPGTGDVTFQTCGGLANTIDTRIGVYAGGCGAIIACDDDGCSGAAPFDSSLTFAATAGTSYNLRVGTFPGEAGGTGSFELSTAGAGGCTGAGGGDTCGDAEAITGEGDFCVDTTVDGGITLPNNTACSGSSFSDGNDRWFAWTAPNDCNATVSTCDLDFDTIVGIYDGTSCPPNFSAEVACNDDSCGLQSSVTFAATGGTTYRIRIAGFSAAASGAGSFNIECAMAGGGDCTTGVYCQDPDQLGHGGGGIVAATSDANPGAGFAAAENFQATADGSVTSLCWWGLYVDFSAGAGPCFSVPADSFTATYYADGGGFPGAVKAGPLPISLTSSGTTGAVVATGVGNLDEYLYTGTHDPVAVTAGECCWVEIQNNTTGGCFWLWSTTGVGDGASAQSDGTGYLPSDFDLAVCVDTDAAACDPPPGPDNDNCADCTPISGEGTFAFNNGTATSDGPDACDKFMMPGVDNDVWYCWTAPCDGDVTIQTCNLTTVDTKLVVYGDTSCPPVGGTEIACNDDTCGFQSLVQFTATSGSTYLIRVGTFPGADGGVGEFSITCGSLTPDNDDCANAQAINVGDTVSGDTSFATDDGLTGTVCGTSVDAPGVWYSFIGTGTTVTVSTCNQASYDTKLHVYCGGCDTLECVGGNDDGVGCAGFSSEVAVCTTAGVEYLILVDGFGGATGAFDLTLSEDGMSCTPTANCAEVGACCASDGTCTVDTQDGCLASGGDWKGPDTDCGGDGSYAFGMSSNSFVDVSGQGTALVLGDDTAESVAIGFGFTYYGTEQTDISVASNGYLSFSGGSDFTNDVCGDAAGTNDVIAGFWDDLSPNLGGAVNAVTLGDPGNQRLMVQYTDVPFFDGAVSGPITFQIVLFEADNSIEYRYLTVPDGTTPTVGIENADGSSSLCVDTTPDDGDVIRIEFAPGINPCVECFLVVGTDNQGGSFDGQVHTWNGIDVGNIVGSWGVTMEDLPLIPLDRVVRFAQGSNAQTRLRQTWGEEPEPAFYAQILMWNPGIFPNNPEQSTQGLAVYALPDGTVYGVPYGQQDGGMTWLDIRTVTVNGQEYFQLPFNVSFQ